MHLQSPPPTKTPKQVIPPRPTVAISLDPEPIPEVLKQRDQWVLWRYDFVKKDHRWQKVPYQINGRWKASSSNPKTWSSFESAVNAYNSSSGFDGIGIVFSPDDEFTGVDLDDCLIDGQLVPEAREIVDAFDTYTEVSPSGNGVKLILRGAKPDWAESRCDKIKGFKEIEVYDRGRYFTVTGYRLEGAPEGVAARQEQLDELCRSLWPPKPKRSATTPRSASVIADDDDLLTRMFESKNGAAIRKLWDGDIRDYVGDDSRADLALCNHLAYWTGTDKERMDRMFRRSALYREKWERQDYRDRTLDRAIADCINVVSHGPVIGSIGKPPSNNGHPRKITSADDGIPIILIGTDEHRVIDEAVSALRADPDLYHRGGYLVRVQREHDDDDKVIRPRGAPTIAQVPTANLRDRLTRCADFVRIGKDGKPSSAHPPQWLVAGVEARGEWPGLRYLEAVSDAPVLRADGTVWQTRGYDAETRVLYEPAGVDFPRIPDGVDEDDADAAKNTLLEVVQDFRFESPEHRAAWLAALLTPLARFAFDGPAPLFLIDANIRGAGKGLLAQTIGQIVLGREIPVLSYSHETEEMRKKITTIAIAGDRVVLLDNLEGTFGNDSLDRALTSTRWKDRILGKTEQVELPLLPIWFGTGNNVQIAADTARRLIHVRLDVLEERPEERSDFQHPDLIAWVREHRGDLLAAGLTILAAYIRAGRPKHDLIPMGSFEGWSSLVREAVVWVGLPDPCLTRLRLTEAADTSADTLGLLVEAFRAYDALDSGLVFAEVLERLYPNDGHYPPRDPESDAMRTALEQLTNCQSGKAPTSRQVGNKLKRFRRRVQGGWYLDVDGEKAKRGWRWRLHPARPSLSTPLEEDTPPVGDSTDSSDSVSAPFAREE